MGDLPPRYDDLAALTVQPCAAGATDTIDLGRALKHGAIGGIIAGLVFSMFEERCRR
jgi:hypothetical protein